jgi:hypothetical protein
MIVDHRTAAPYMMKPYAASAEHLLFILFCRLNAYYGFIALLSMKAFSTLPEGNDKPRYFESNFTST